MKRLFLYLASTCAISSCVNQDGMQKAEYSGADLTDRLFIVRDKETRSAEFTSAVGGDYLLYAGPSVGEIDFGRPVLSGDGLGTFALAVPDSVRSYFQFIAGDDKAILAERHLPMTGGYNFRDLGGYRTMDGKYVKWGKFIRSDDLHHLTDADLRYLASVPVRTVVDFRSGFEIDSLPDRVPPGAEGIELSISPGNLSNAMTLEDLSAEKMDTLMMEMNRLFVTDSVCLSQYRAFFHLIRDADRMPVMFHCSAGKDRTGMASALILFSLGVDEETILRDYLLSNRYLGDKYAPYLEEYPQLAPLFEVKESFLRAGIEQIRADHGSVDAFLREDLGVDIERMRDFYLY